MLAVGHYESQHLAAKESALISYSRVALMREQSNPKVYFVYGGFKFWIQNPAALFALGFDWSKVQVVPDGTLIDLPEKTFDTTSPVKASDVFFQAGVSVPFVAPDPYESMMSKNPANIIRKNIVVAGWLTDPGSFGRLNCWATGPANARVPFAAEDYHYDVILDVDFIDQMYGLGGLSSALNGAVLPGNLSETNPQFVGPPMRFDDILEVDGSSRGVTPNSFALPHMAGAINRSDNPQPTDVMGFEDPMPNNYRSKGPVFIHGELNCWHANNGPFGVRQYFGRGQAPAGWVQWSACEEPNGDAWWPYLPYNPDNGPLPLQTGDYVLMKGTLWQEHAHDMDTPSLWRAEASTLMHCGLIEMHPPDWIVRVQPPPIRKTAFMVACCTARRVGDTPSSVPVDAGIFPYPYLQPPPAPNSGFQWRKLIDGRFSHPGTFQDQASVEPGANTNIPGSVSMGAMVHATNVQGRFKAVYEVWWEMPLMASCFPDHALIGSSVNFRVHAEDSSTHASVAGTVKAAGVPIGSSDKYLLHVFRPTDLPLTFSAPNFSDIPLSFTLQPGILHVTTTPITFDELISVTVSATNAAGEPVTHGDVLISGVKVGVLGKPFNHTFIGSLGGQQMAEPAPEAHPGKALPLLRRGGGGGHLPPGIVNAPGYQLTAIPWRVN